MRCEAATGPVSSFSVASRAGLGIDIGRRQFYRVLDAVLGAGDAIRGHDGNFGAPRGRTVGGHRGGFSTLLDTDFALALIDLCRRGHVVVAVDVLGGAPFESGAGPVDHRMWALQRSSCTATWARSALSGVLAR